GNSEAGLIFATQFNPVSSLLDRSLLGDAPAERLRNVSMANRWDVRLPEIRRVCAPNTRKFAAFIPEVRSIFKAELPEVRRVCIVNTRKFAEFIPEVRRVLETRLPKVRRIYVENADSADNERLRLMMIITSFKAFNGCVALI
ncbi:hypothetical protein, partial [Deinococcus sp. Arct2-2]|uniref:hypothetical protein n=1 Tax=Deinococcus sp. Arct2-2 TaxID=2568653 RepID=UPI00197AD913